MTRIVTVTKIGKDASSERMRYRVEITGPAQDQRTFEVLVLTAVTSKTKWEEEIKKVFSHGWLPEDGAVQLLGSSGW